jgi:hypothetical protein
VANDLIHIVFTEYGEEIVLVTKDEKRAKEVSRYSYYETWEIDGKCVDTVYVGTEEAANQRLMEEEDYEEDARLEAKMWGTVDAANRAEEEARRAWDEADPIAPEGR